MSVQKFRPGKLKHEDKQIPWTQILNDVLQQYTSARELGVWCYLQSKPENWEVSVKNICNHFKDIGKDQAYKILKELRRVNLLKRIDYKNHDGTHYETNYIVLSGSNFDNNGEVFEENNKQRNIESVTIDQSYPQEPLPDYQNPDYQNPENQDYIKERVLQTKDKTKKKERSLCLKNKQKTERKSYCPGTWDLIISDEALEIAKQKNIDWEKTAFAFMDYAKANGWLMYDWKAAFCKWLRDERTIQAPKHIKNNEPRCTVPWFNPDHATVN